MSAHKTEEELTAIAICQTCFLATCMKPCKNNLPCKFSIGLAHPVKLNWRGVPETHYNCLGCGELIERGGGHKCPPRPVVTIQSYKTTGVTGQSWDDHEIHSYTVDGE